MKTFFFLLFSFCFLLSSSQKLSFPKNISANDSSLQQAMTSLAAHVIPIYKEEDTLNYLENVFYYQMAAGLYRKALSSLDAEDKAYGDTGTQAGAVALQFRSFALAKEAQVFANKPFTLLYADTLKALYTRLPEGRQDYVGRFFTADTTQLRKSLDEKLSKAAMQDSLSLSDARALLQTYISWNVNRQVLPVAKPFLKAERDKRYITQDNVLIKMPDGAQLSATIVRRVKDTRPVPVIMLYNIYADSVGEDYQVNRATEAAEKGYVGIIVNTRGKKGSPQAIEPFEHDAQDAYWAIDWISKQPWCNGKIGMYGGSYLGFAQWSATKKLHPALKTIVPQVAVGIGIDYPAHNGVFMSYMLQWIHYVTNNKSVDAEEFRNEVKWDSVFLKWYKSGRAFRALDSIEGRPNAIFQRWLKHPSQDKFWQDMVPYGKDFAAINIPVLTTTGYFDDDQRGAFYYLQEHLKWNKGAKHYLVIGPWDHPGGQGYPRPSLDKYKLDSAGFINVNEKVVFPWFDYVLKDSAFPSFLKNKVNFQVAGANEWRSASSLKTASNDSMLLYLSNVRTKDGYKLSTRKSAVKSFIAQEISYTDRDAYNRDLEDHRSAMDTVLHSGEDLVFISEPLPQATVMNGSFEGNIKAVLNKKDMDLQVRLYELTVDGNYFLLANFLGRASYFKDRTKRQLLQPGKEETLSFNNSYWGCRKLAKGSRIVACVGMIKSPDWQVNYGTGKDVSDETIADGKVPLQIQWMNNSYLKIPLLK